MFADDTAVPLQIAGVVSQQVGATARAISPLRSITSRATASPITRFAVLPISGKLPCRSAPLALNASKTECSGETTQASLPKQPCDGEQQPVVVGPCRSSVLAGAPAREMIAPEKHMVPREQLVALPCRRVVSPCRRIISVPTKVC